MKQVDDRHARCLPREHRMQLADIGIGETEIGKQDDHAWNINSFYRGGWRALPTNYCRLASGSG